MSLFHRKNQETIEAAKASIERAEHSLSTANRQFPTVESLVNTVKDRRERNGFGDDFSITMTPRKAH